MVFNCTDIALPPAMDPLVMLTHTLTNRTFTKFLKEKSKVKPSVTVVILVKNSTKISAERRQNNCYIKVSLR